MAQSSSSTTSIHLLDSGWKKNTEWLDNPCNAISLYRRVVRRIKQDFPLDPTSWDNKINDFEFDQWHGQIDLRLHGTALQIDEKVNSVTIFLHHGKEWITLRFYQGMYDGFYRYRTTIEASSETILVLAKLYFSEIKLQTI